MGPSSPTVIPEWVTTKFTGEEYPVPILTIGMPDIFGKSGKGMELFDYFHIGVNDIVEKTDKFFKRDYI